MSIRQALRRQAEITSRKRGKEPGRFSGSNAILTMMAGLFAIVCAVNIIQG